MEDILFNFFIIFMLIFAALIFVILIFVSAPYGQHIREKWGPNINNKAGWIIMELPTVVIYLILWLIGERPFKVMSMVSWLFPNMRINLIRYSICASSTCLAILRWVFALLIFASMIIFMFIKQEKMDYYNFPLQMLTLISIILINLACKKEKI